jgi:hypothetical protein
LRRSTAERFDEATIVELVVNNRESDKEHECKSAYCHGLSLNEFHTYIMLIGPDDLALALVAAVSAQQKCKNGWHIADRVRDVQTCTALAYVADDTPNIGSTVTEEHLCGTADP